MISRKRSEMKHFAIIQPAIALYERQSLNEILNFSF